MRKGRYICSFVLHRREAGGPAHLVCRLRWDGSRSPVSLNVGFTVDPGGWSPREQRCLKGSTHGRNRVPAAVVNREIERFEEAARTTFDRLEGWPTADEVRASMRALLELDRPDTPDLDAAMDEFIAENTVMHGWEKTTVQKFRALQAQLHQWRQDVGFEDFDESGLRSWVAFAQGDLKLRNVTVLKKMDFLRWFLRWSRKKGYMKDGTFETFRPALKTAQNRVVYLTWDELMRLWKWEVPEAKPWLGVARDIFLFQAFTSVRFSDAHTLRREDIFPDSFFVITKKTDDPLEIDLNKWSRAILDRYKDLPDGYALPRMCGQRANIYIKEVMRECGIDEPTRRTIYDGSGRNDEVVPKWQLVGTHTARRTFICNALAMGIPPNTVMRWTGHSSYASMRPYIDVADEERRKAMSAFDRR